MRNFMQNQPLVNSIETNNLGEIKSQLIDNLFFLQGDRDEIYKAITYAENNSEFQFEDHIDLEDVNKEDRQNYFSQEKWNMEKNFSRERYDLLINLYGEVFGNPVYDEKEDLKTSNKLKNITPAVLITGGVLLVVAGYLIYKSLE